MNNEKPTSSTAIAKKSKSWHWVWLSIVGAIIARLFGLVGALVFIGAYCWLKPKMGTWVAIAAAGVLAEVSPQI